MIRAQRDVNQLPHASRLLQSELILLQKSATVRTRLIAQPWQFSAAVVTGEHGLSLCTTMIIAENKFDAYDNKKITR
jgi:hypothetical protein